MIIEEIKGNQERQKRAQTIWHHHGSCADLVGRLACPEWIKGVSLSVYCFWFFYRVCLCSTRPVEAVSQSLDDLCGSHGMAGHTGDFNFIVLYGSYSYRPYGTVMW